MTNVSTNVLYDKFIAHIHKIGNKWLEHVDNCSHTDNNPLYILIAFHLTKHYISDQNMISSIQVSERVNVSV